MKKMKAIFQKLWIKIYSSRRRKKLKNMDFTIIANNCWAGKIYNSYNLPYKTPTIGCFIMPKDFLKMCEDLKTYMDIELLEVSPENSKYRSYFEKNFYEYNKFGKYPIGRLNDIEIHFLHYETFNVSKENWDRRKKRINWENIIIKLNDQNGLLEEDFQRFNLLAYKNKLFWSSNDLFGIRVTKNKYLEYQDEPYGSSKVFNMTEYLNEVNL